LIAKPLDEEFLTYIGKFFVSHKGEAVIAKITAHLPDDQITYQVVKKIEADPPKVEKVKSE
jgi:hypothetical protein